MGWATAEGNTDVVVGEDGHRRIFDWALVHEFLLGVQQVLLRRQCDDGCVLDDRLHSRGQKAECLLVDEAILLENVNLSF